MGLFGFGKKKASSEPINDAWDDDAWDEEDDDYDDESERLSVYDAALIWMSNGKDEDYTFGYSEEELEDALG